MAEAHSAAGPRACALMGVRHLPALISNTIQQSQGSKEPISWEQLTEGHSTAELELQRVREPSMSTSPSASAKGLKAKGGDHAGER